MGQIIVIGNEKGGAGKSTIALHIAMACVKAGQKTVAIDLDLRQKTFDRFLENRTNWSRLSECDLLMPELVNVPALAPTDSIETATQVAQVVEIIENARANADFVIIDTPGSNTETAKAALAMADIIITPMNDSFVDFDLLAVLDPISEKIGAPSFYSHVIWDARKQKAGKEKKQIEWLILRNRMSQLNAKNKRRVGDALGQLAKRLGFKIIPGLCERVIYRELFPKGLTLLDLEDKKVGIPLALSHVAALQELRELMYSLNLSRPDGDEISF